ncbi:hypothetical protein TWF970_009993 [Orbilia oligospora]|uniref:Uncharacterized protein n=1 Tax=Orbilia oligospora TaxID=2813651 RepID=A0A7C8V019_ORBOL|nr:hypothetical protein TWF970_009993 [Orbilia oligospora]
MAGLVENFDREGRLSREQQHPQVLQCPQSNDLSRSHYGPLSGSAGFEYTNNTDLDSLTGFQTSPESVVDEDDDASFQEQQISFHRSKVADGLSHGEWDEAENHLSILLKDLNIDENPDMQILQAMTYNSKARWQEAHDLLKNFKHQSTSEPEMSARAYYAKAVALYKLRDYEASHTNSRRGLAVVEKFLTEDTQQKYKSEFGDLAARTLEDLGNTTQAAKAQYYKSLIHESHTEDPILLVTTVSQSSTPPTTEESEASKAKLIADMQKYRLSFGHDGKILVGRQKDIFYALKAALDSDNLPLMTIICTNDWCATQSLRESPIYYDLDPPMPQYAWRATTLLHVVSGSHSKYSAPMAQLLLDRGANPQTTLFEGITPLHICARQTNAEVASVLIKNGANIEARSITGKPPIHFAAWKASWNADVRILKMLISAGANINAKNSGGYTALHWCMFDGRSSAPIEVLLKRPEIDKYVRAGNHKTPWDIFWEHEEEFMEKGEEKRVQILYTLKRYGITR